MHALDIYHSGEPFDPEKFLPALVKGDLTHLDVEKIPQVLKTYQKAQTDARSRDERNLLALGIGYLQLRKGDYKSALHQFRERILGNFILDDLRLHFESQALRGRAVEAFESKKYSLAIKSLLQSIDRRLRIFETFPDSSFNAEVSRHLAEDEKLLGDIYQETFNYKAAWQVYRKSLMREFPENETHKTQVTLALAKTYEAAGELAEAVDSYVLLLNDTENSEARMAAIEFFRGNEKRLAKEGIDLQPFHNAMNPIAEETSANEAADDKSLPRLYENSAVRDFYENLHQRDYPEIFESGRRVLSQYPGIYEAKGVARAVRNRMVSFLETHSWESSLDQVADLYPARDLAEIGLKLWKKNRPEQAAVFYKKIVNRYSMENQLCHKALYFLGRIYEDLGDISTALGYYHLLLEKYDFGAFTTAALFKVPWIERLRGENDKARYHFTRLMSFYDSPVYAEWKSLYPLSDSFEPAAYYWLARNESALGNTEGRSEWMRRLIEKFPFDFYSILARLELKMGLNGFLNDGMDSQLDYRANGLGDINRKRLSHAEKLIAVGFLDFAEMELAQITSGRGNSGFLIYLARLFQQAQGYQKSIGLNWSILKANGGSAMTGSLAQGLFPQAWLEKAQVFAGELGLDPWFILSLMRQESAFNEKIVSSANAVGLMQLLPSTAAEVARSIDMESFDPEQLKEPETNLILGVNYLSRLLMTFNGNAVHALAAYNAGEHKVKEWIGIRGNLGAVEFIESIPYNETRNYVKKIIRNYAIYNTLYKKESIDGLKELLVKISN
ncbi:hypothetical protein UR09_03870 [Candidatus Nitromaritima sp. SCGC AAA799-A02]|nr:hypothetical protein UZ36_06065 [Candidatus Nitromaritima sp. SCGC AAA799-C22]KMP11236.1 hypothetical protein UR09_03870 [Candidatus Nitromaritima sp. SCGC AAA799-A02]